jgi:hypothetical protein
MGRFKDFIGHQRDQRRERQQIREILSEENHNFW